MSFSKFNIIPEHLTLKGIVRGLCGARQPLMEASTRAPSILTIVAVVVVVLLLILSLTFPVLRSVESIPQRGPTITLRNYVYLEFMHPCTTTHRNAVEGFGCGEGLFCRTLIRNVLPGTCISTTTRAFSTKGFCMSRS